LLGDYRYLLCWRRFISYMKKYIVLLLIILIPIISQSSTDTVAGNIPQDWSNSTILTYSWATLNTGSMAGMYVAYALYPSYWTATSYQTPLVIWDIKTTSVSINTVVFSLQTGIPFQFHVRTYNQSSALWTQSTGSRWLYCTLEVPNSVIPSVSSTQGDTTNILFSFSTSTNFCPIAFQIITLDTTTSTWISFYTTYQFAVPSTGTFIIYSKTRNLALTESIWSVNTIYSDPIYGIIPSRPYLVH